MQQKKAPDNIKGFSVIGNILFHIVKNIDHVVILLHFFE